MSVVAAWGAWLAAHRSARTAETLERIERDRRHEERRPQFELTLDATYREHATLNVHLAGPDELGEVTVVSIRVDDDDKDRTRLLGNGATADDIANHVWGPWRFTSRVDTVDEHGRTAGPFTLKVGRGKPFQMERTRPGYWMTGRTMDQWQEEYRGHPVRLVMVCRAGGEEWTLARAVPNEEW
ncbi:hypothetical protein [Streptomyces sp. B3I7]|uniref:hypothetical protein n=1 Tax=Streptomyces sp. B3I7 TaxID=3042269 RepID=UPI0027D90CEC|nr:hypothetical protein [Streptomyces sp. B3I7]